MSDGPSKFFGIVEVRDRQTPIGSSYVEEIYGKKRSLLADAAFLVSKSGFTKPAIKKANQLGIRTLTYEEAQKGDWSGWCKIFSVSVIHKKFNNVAIYLFDTAR